MTSVLFSKKAPLLWLLSYPSSSSFTLVPPLASSLLQSKRFVGSSRTMTLGAAKITLDSIRGQTVVPIEDAIVLHAASTNVKFLDGSWFLTDRNGRLEFENGPRIAGAQFFDIDDISTDSHLPHMMPPKELFAAAMDAMGISNEDHIIVYGSQGCPFVSRAWFQIRNMGHGNDYCHLLNGSIMDWKEKGGPIEEGPPSRPIVSAKDLILEQANNKYQATDAQNIVDLEEMKAMIAHNADCCIVDVRAPERFLGQVEEPRPGMRLGHMPGAKNVFFKDLLNPDNVLQFKPKEELELIISQGGVDVATEKRIVVHCGSGATACVLVAALDICGRKPNKTYVYDGSWSEWGSLPDTPIVKGADE